jgi:hypothetical protein
MSVDCTLGLADLLVDPAQRAPGPIMVELVGLVPQPGH